MLIPAVEAAMCVEAPGMFTTSFIPSKDRLLFDWEKPMDGELRTKMVPSKRPREWIFLYMVDKLNYQSKVGI